MLFYSRREEMPSIRIRACLAVVFSNEILLVPHYYNDGRPVQWHLPGDGVNYLETLEQAAIREFYEETGLHARADKQYFVSEVIEPETPWHSIAISFLGIITGGILKAEGHHFSAKWGDKTPRWFSEAQLNEVRYHPPAAIKAAFVEVRKLR